MQLSENRGRPKMEQEYWKIMNQVQELPKSQIKVSLLEEAVRIADALNDINKGYDARLELVMATSDIGLIDKTIVAYTWCLSIYDKFSEQFDYVSLMWRYKWIVSHLDEFPQISFEKIDQVYEDMKQRYTSFEISLRPYYQYKHKHALNRGDIELAQLYYDKWINAEVDYWSDCKACEVDQKVHSQYLLGNVDQCLELATPIINGSMRCGEVPHLTLAVLLLPLLQKGNLNEAEKLETKSYKLIKTNKKFLPQLSYHLNYLTIINPRRAFNLFEKYLPWALETNNYQTKFNYYLASYVFLSLNDKAKEKLKISKLPDYITFEWIEAQTNQIAELFNKRNGNSFYKDRIKTQYEQISMIKESIAKIHS